MRSLCAAIGLLFLAQTPGFEAASVRLNKSGVARYSINPKGDRFSATNISLLSLVTWAYDLEAFQIVGAPSWFTSQRFDLEARAEGTPSIEQFRLMLQPLLAERFALRVYRETRQGAVYDLEVAKGGPKLKAAHCLGTPSPNNPCGGFTGSPRGSLVGRADSLGDFAKNLSSILGRPVVDKTGLEGTYDFDLNWTPDEMARQGPGDPDAPVADANGFLYGLAGPTWAQIGVGEGDS